MEPSTFTTPATGEASAQQRTRARRKREAFRHGRPGRARVSLVPISIAIIGASAAEVIYWWIPIAQQGNACPQRLEAGRVHGIKSARVELVPLPILFWREPPCQKN